MENVTLATLDDTVIYKLSAEQVLDSPLRNHFVLSGVQIRLNKEFEMCSEKLGDGYSRLSFFREGKHLSSTTAPASTHVPKNMPFRPFFKERAFDNPARGVVYTTGSDPEMFAVDAKDELIPAFEWLPSKDKALKFGDTKLYWDGFQAEFTTQARSCHVEHIHSIGNQLIRLREQLVLKFPKAKLTLKNVFTIPPVKLSTYAREVVDLGCSSSYNAYGTSPIVVDNPFELPFRMAGGHIHLGMDNKYLKLANPFVKLLDLFLTIPTVGMFSEIDDPVRRNFYGRAGEYRLPKHGLEYRTLSNAWLGNPSVSYVILDTARMLCDRIFAENVDIKRDFGVDPEEVREIIDATDVAAARKLFQKTKEPLLKAHTIYYKEQHAQRSITGEPKNPAGLFEKMVMEGVESVIPTYRDIEHNWGLKKVNAAWNPWSSFCVKH